MVRGDSPWGKPPSKNGEYPVHHMIAQKNELHNFWVPCDVSTWVFQVSKTLLEKHWLKSAGWKVDMWSFPGVVVVAFPSLRWNPDFFAYGFLSFSTNIYHIPSNEWVTHNPREHTFGPLGFQACVPEYDYAGEIRQPSGVPTQFGGIRKPPWFFPKSLQAG